MNTNTNHPYAGSRATKMLSKAIERTTRDEHLTALDIAHSIGLKSAVTVSQLKNGKLPVPIARVTDIAKTVKLDPADFLVAVLEQRYPEVNVKRLIKKYVTNEERRANERKARKNAN